MAAVYRGRRVLVTGHTGFKGGWLAAWLHVLGAEVFGFALEPPPGPGVFCDAGLDALCHHTVGDVRDAAAVEAAIRGARPEAIFHLAAQPIVRLSYERPVETVETNVMGTANVLNAVRTTGTRAAVVVVTTDKVYADRDWDFGYRETDSLSGYDPYAGSKAACEIIVASFRQSFFQPSQLQAHGVALATARAGNVIGGGDWAADRILPDAIRALTQERPIGVRNPDAVRPWQHVLEPLGGYLILGARLMASAASDAAELCDAWNFGPWMDNAQPVRRMVDEVVKAWGTGSWVEQREANPPHETKVLRLSTDKAQSRLGWTPKWDLPTTVARTVEWYRAQALGAGASQLRALMTKQIEAYTAA